VWASGHIHQPGVNSAVALSHAMLGYFRPDLLDSA
jgi:hypothetical protein